VDTVEATLAAWAPRIHPGDYFNQFLRRPAEPKTWGLLWITGDIWNFPPIAAHKLELGVDADWFDGPEQTPRLERFVSLFRAEIEAMDAFWAGAELTSLRRQRMTSSSGRSVREHSGCRGCPGRVGTAVSTASGTSRG
jgi:hypothetical protein